MSCIVSLDAGALVVADPAGKLRGRLSSQLAYWGLTFDPATNRYVQRTTGTDDTPERIITYLQQAGLQVTVESSVAERIARLEERRQAVLGALHDGREVKEGHLNPALQRDFSRYLAQSVPRKLKDHQVKAALHLLTVVNGANFSVPGSGKTTVALVVYAYLKERGDVNCLFVVGPPSCFGPWKSEFEKTFGVAPATTILAGGDVTERRQAYFDGNIKDLYLTSFQTLQRDQKPLVTFFEDRGVYPFFVIDEAHYIKQGGGAWATAVLDVAQHATRRVIMTGTPFPQGYADAFNLTDALWPDASPLTQDDRARIVHGSPQDAVDILDRKVGPLFYRVRKQDLGLTPQDFREPTLIPMNPTERQLYNAIVSRMRALPLALTRQDWDALVRLRRGRLIRLRQCASYPALLRTSIPESDEDVTGGDPQLTRLIREYDQRETPAKLVHLEFRIGALRAQGAKVLVWATFVGTLELIRDRLIARGHSVGLIYGRTPLASASEEQEETRERIIEQFLSPTGYDILVANPAACAESISLHSACSHAIYYDMTYNCAQYLQSLDRIHRVGGSEHRIAHYEFLQCENTIDQDILAAVRRKAARMQAIIDQDYPIYDLDMTTGDENDDDAYDRLIG